MTVQTFTLPEMPPSTNNLYANRAGRGRVKSDAYRNWLSAARWTLKAQGARVITGDVRIEIRVGPRRANADCTNRLKPIEDALSGIAFADDKFVAGASIEWAPIEGVQITVREAHP